MKNKNKKLRKWNWQTTRQLEAMYIDLTVCYLGHNLLSNNLVYRYEVMQLL